MKFVTPYGVALLAGSAAAAVCPFSLMKRAGLLNKDDEAAYDAVKANPEAANDII